MQLDIVIIPIEGYLTPLGRTLCPSVELQVNPRLNRLLQVLLSKDSFFFWNSVSTDIVTLPVLNQFNMSHFPITHVCPIAFTLNNPLHFLLF